MRHAAPAANQRDEVWRARPPPRRARARRGPRGRARGTRRAPRAPRRRSSARTRASPSSADERLVCVERLLDLQRVVRHQLGRGVDGGQAAADDDRRQPHLQVRQRVALERAGELQRHQEVARLADAADQVVLHVDDRRPAGAGGDRDVIEAVAPTRPRSSACRRSGCRRRSAGRGAAPASGAAASGSSCPSAR